MSKKQTRRSISVSGEVYDRLQAYVKANGKTGSGVVEDMLRAFFEMDERAQKAVVEVIPRFERKTAAHGFRDEPTPPLRRPAQVGDPLVGGPRVKEVVMATPVLEKNGDWVEKPAAPVDRIAAIKEVVEAKTEPGKKPGTPLADMASKIFTF